MFGFDKPEDGSAERFAARKPLFEAAFERLPHARYYLWWLVHNCVSHPLIGVAPIRRFFAFHDWTSRRMHPGAPTPTNEAVLRLAVARIYTLTLRGDLTGVSKLAKETLSKMTARPS